MTPNDRFRPGTSKLESLTKGTKAVYGLAKIIAPAFQREDLGMHVDYIIKHDPIINEYVKRDPKYRLLLRDKLEDVYKNYKPYLISAGIVDTWDRATSALGEAAQFVPGVGNLFAAGEEMVELVPKIVYSAMYAHGTGDYNALPYFAVNELASFTPYVGEAIDFKNIYLERARERLRKRASEDFMKAVAPSWKTVQ